MFPKYLINPYLGVFCSGTIFSNLVNITPKREYKNKKIISFIVLKTIYNSFKFSFVPFTIISFSKNIYDEYY